MRARFPPYSEYFRTLHDDEEVSLFEIVGYPPPRR
jgi:hypothetical protein